MTKTIMFILTLTIVILFSCKSTPNLTENEVYKILNEIIADDSLRINKICWKFNDLALTGEYANEFTAQDREFIYKQKTILTDITIKSNKLKWYSPRTKSFDFIKVDTICNTGILYHFSFPLISSDRRKVIIEITENCNCLLGGQGGKDLYEKVNGRWKRTKTFDRWISEKNNYKTNRKKAGNIL